jgi:hypothetical protein
MRGWFEMNWREVNVKGGFVAGWIIWGFIAFLLTNVFFAAAIDGWLGANAPSVPGARISLMPRSSSRLAYICIGETSN